jgi:hypothetical protein
LLRRHVPWRSHHHSSLGPRLGVFTRGLFQARQAEIEDLDATIRGEKNVVRLQIPMNDALGVHSRETFCKSGSNVHGLAPGRRAARQEGSQGLAFQQFSDGIVGAVLGSRVEDRQDIGMRERRHCLVFADESRQSTRILRKMLRQNLDRHIATKPRVVCSVDLAHTAGANGCKDLVRSQTSSGSQSHKALNDFILPGCSAPADSK